jgi:hypothetical protein
MCGNILGSRVSVSDFPRGGLGVGGDAAAKPLRPFETVAAHGKSASVND